MKLQREVVWNPPQVVYKQYEPLSLRARLDSLLGRDAVTIMYAASGIAYAWIALELLGLI